MQFQDDDAFQRNRDVLDGVIFIATLQIRTPLSVLQHHGEFHPGPPSAVPKYGSLADGIWIYKTKSWSELAGRKVREPITESCCASDIGPIQASKYLPFLKKFRTIVESNDSVDQKLALLFELRNSSEDFRDTWSRLQDVYPNFPQSFFYLQLAVIPGIGATTAERLFNFGFRTINDLQCASESELKRVPSLGTKLISRIRDYFASGPGVSSKRSDR